MELPLIRASERRAPRNEKCKTEKMSNREKHTNTHKRATMSFAKKRLGASYHAVVTKILACRRKFVPNFIEYVSELYRKKSDDSLFFHK